jgi:diacylglycerol kinase (ATP)
MDQNNFFAIVSSKAGKYNEDIRREISDVFSGAGLTVDFYSFTDKTKLADEIIQAQSKGYYSFLAIGGDGTVSLLASCLCGKPHRLGIIPAGTTNTLARVLNIPLVIKEAIELIATSRNIKSADGLKVNDRIFILNVSVGLSTVFIKNVDSKQKSKWGIGAYILGFIRNYNKIKARAYDLNIDGNNYHTKAVELHVTNTGVIGTPRFRIYPDSRIDDGKAEVLSMRHRSISEFFNVLLDILTRRKRQAIQMIGSGRDILIQSKSPIEVQGDGDILQKTPVKIQVQRQSINFIV